MRTVEENIELSKLLFSDVTESVEDILKRYPKRKLPVGSLALRFAPSPTGFVHIGSIYMALINEKLVRQNSGVFILRIEDTDKVREVSNSIPIMVNGIKDFGIKIDEGVVDGKTQKGEYGPYIQSERVDIYKVFAKDLVAKGLAYPCFATKEELDEIREKQNELKVRTGYYGKWAKWREKSIDDVKTELEKGTPFVIRLYSTGNSEERFNIKDLIKGSLTLPENDMDAVLLKSDGFPTYHFAHPIDDTLMDITFVLRGDEWLPSEPLHVEIFKALGFEQIQYGHPSPLMKIDEGGGKRKLSKRKDPEADIAYYIEKGYPIEAVKEYLLNIANSNLYDWRVQNPDAPVDEFHIKLEKFNRSGALFDIVKLGDICKEYIAKLSAQEVYNRVVEWAYEYDKELEERLSENRDYSINVLNIEREGPKIRKDIGKWSDVRDQFEIFFDDMFKDMQKVEVEMEKGLQRKIVTEFLDMYYQGDAVDEWFGKIKMIAERNGFATDYKEYNEHPKSYNGKVGDVAMVLRVAVTGRTQSPDLYQVMEVLGEDRVRARLNEYVQNL